MRGGGAHIKETTGYSASLLLSRPCVDVHNTDVNDCTAFNL
jgi:hypothetical protein